MGNAPSGTTVGFSAVTVPDNENPIRDQAGGLQGDVRTVLACKKVAVQLVSGHVWNVARSSLRPHLRRSLPAVPTAAYVGTSPLTEGRLSTAGETKRGLPWARMLSTVSRIWPVDKLQPQDSESDSRIVRGHTVHNCCVTRSQARIGQHWRNAYSSSDCMDSVKPSAAPELVCSESLAGGRLGSEPLIGELIHICKHCSWPRRIY
jgi:hypothetical protein